jgi:hypothetical protein
MFKRRRLIVLIALFLGGALSSACSRQLADPPVAGPARTMFGVLFIGNSLTYENDLPRTLAGLTYDGGDTLQTAAAAYPDYALIDHYKNTDSNARALIASHDWDYVVMQQGPTSQQIGRDTLIIAAQLFAPLIRDAHARPALYMVWPEKARLEVMPDVMASYEQAAAAVDGAVFAAGVAWQAAWGRDPSLPLYGSDNFHPSRIGTYLAALVMYEQVTHRDARLLPARASVGGNLNLPEATFRLLQDAAHQANLAYGLAITR